jgi:transposase-like protein
MSSLQLFVETKENVGNDIFISTVSAEALGVKDGDIVKISIPEEHFETTIVAHINESLFDFVVQIDENLPEILGFKSMELHVSKVEQSNKEKPKDTRKVEQNKIKCIYCGSFDLKEEGDRSKPPISFVPRPIYPKKYTCKKCRKTFTKEQMDNPPAAADGAKKTAKQDSSLTKPEKATRDSKPAALFNNIDEEIANTVGLDSEFDLDAFLAKGLGEIPQKDMNSSPEEIDQVLKEVEVLSVAYAEIPISRVAKRTGIEDEARVVNILKDLISEGKINGRLSGDKIIPMLGAKKVTINRNPRKSVDAALSPRLGQLINALDRVLNQLSWSQEKKDMLKDELISLPEAEQITFLEQLGVEIPLELATPAIPAPVPGSPKKAMTAPPMPRRPSGMGGQAAPQITRYGGPNSSTSEEINEPPFPAYAGTEPFAFISYAHKDRNRVYPIIKYLHDMGIPIWYDEGLEAGSDWRGQIIKNLKKCSQFVAFLSPLSVTRHDVLNEIAIAEKRFKEENVPMIPVLLDNFVLPDEIEYTFSRINTINKQLLSEITFLQKLYDALTNK